MVPDSICHDAGRIRAQHRCRVQPFSAPTQLALLFELRTPNAATSHRRTHGLTTQRGRTKRDATASPTEPSRLAVRPAIRGKSGAWTRQGITWSNLPHQQYRLELDPAQHRWFLQFAALHRATRLTYFPQDGDWLYLDDFANNLLTVDPATGQSAYIGNTGLSTNVGAFGGDAVAGHPCYIFRILEYRAISGSALMKSATPRSTPMAITPRNT